MKVWEARSELSESRCGAASTVNLITGKVRFVFYGGEGIGVASCSRHQCSDCLLDVKGRTSFVIAELDTLYGASGLHELFWLSS